MAQSSPTHDETRDKIASLSPPEVPPSQSPALFADGVRRQFNSSAEELPRDAVCYGAALALMEVNDILTLYAYIGRAKSNAANPIKTER